MPLKDKLPKGVLDNRRKGPLWKGPEEDGITFSLLSRFICCPERFRLQVVEGLVTKQKFNPSIEYGSMWHACEEAGDQWEDGLGDYCAKLDRKYPLAREDIVHWYELCLAQFPEYVKYWSRHPEQVTKTELMKEDAFNVQYRLPSGRIVRLRGKRDGVDLIEANKTKGVWLQENKTKSQIDSAKIQRQLRYDLQTMLYIISMREEQSYLGDNTFKARTSYRVGKERHFYPIMGVRYNVVRRSAHKSAASMLKKITEDIADGRGGEWFSRWNVEITDKDVEKFRRQTLDPLLERLCAWWETLNTAKTIPGRKEMADPFSLTCNGIPLHYQHPFGVYNVLDEGGSSDLDAYLETGSEVGLERTNNLYPELT